MGLNYKRIIQQEALRLGFAQCGFSKADFLKEDAPRLEQWLKKGMQGEMHYMENHFDKRLDPRLLVTGAKTVISLLFNYFPAQGQSDKTAPKISKYAFGKDYHLVVKEQLFQLIAFIRLNIGEVDGRCFVDSGPVLERSWAKRAGLGWIGKNGNLINRKSGSFFFLAELIIDLELEPDEPFVGDFCGTCNKCVDSCPTQAIIAPQVVDGSKCISYFTIELKEAIPVAMKGQFDGWAFGCDVCQDVCPWNRFAQPHQSEELRPYPTLLDMTKRDWEEITEAVFKKVFKDSPLKRTKFAGIKRNLEFLKGEGDGEELGD